MSETPVRPRLTLTLDGREVEFEPGERLIDLIRRQGGRVPSLCDDPRLAAGGHCRLCVVRVNGRPTASCVLRAADGMKVENEAEDLVALRRMLLEMTESLTAEGECQRCRLGPTLCEMHRQMEEWEARPGRFAGWLGGERKFDDSNPFLLRDYSRCIHCYRCVRICDEVQGDTALTASGRGFTTNIATWFERGLEQSTCEFCGQCIHTCPTGALADWKMLKRLEAVGLSLGYDQGDGEAGKQVVHGPDRPRKGNVKTDPLPLQRVNTVCPYCGTGCGIRLVTYENRLMGSEPRMGYPSSNGALCVKGQFGVDFVHSPERLRHPLMKQPDGTFKEASWDEALDFIAAKLKRIKEESGPEALAFWASARTTSESNYLLMKFARGVIGSNNVDNCQRT